MNHCEREWLKYARNVLTCAGGPETCCLGSAPDGHVKRWPGYLGKHYATGRVLLVGEIHNGNKDSLASLFKAKEILDLERLAREWARLDEPTEREDQRYLETIRDVYPNAAAFWRAKRGNVWRRLQKILDALQLHKLENVAFTNLAKCFDPRGNEAVKACQKKDKFPLADLIEVLDPEPVMVFIAKSTIDTRSLFAPLRTNERHVYEYDNMHGTIWDDVQRKWLKESVWLPDAAKAYAEFRMTGLLPPQLPLSVTR